MKIFFYSDPHFGHSNIIKHCNRPFGNAMEMNEYLIKKYNEVVKEEDLCIWLGDSFLCSFDKAKDVFNQLNGKKVIIRGNHCPSVSRLYRIGFDFVCEEMTLKLAGKYVKLHHFPYALPWWKVLFDKNARKRQQYRPIDKGNFLLHGHVHNTWSRINKKQINISCDVWDYSPISEETIVRIIQKGKKK